MSTDIKSFVDVEIRSNSKTESAQIESDLNRINRAAKGTADTTKATSAEFEAAGKSAKSGLGEASRQFRSTKDAADLATPSINKYSTGLKGLLSTMGGFAKAGLVAAGITAIGMSIAGAIGTFGTFEQKLADLSAITGATGKDLEYYSEQAREMAKASTMGASEIVNAFQLVGSAKPELLQNAEALKTVTSSALTLAEAAGIQIPEAADVMASALNQFGAGADQADRFINVLAAGANFGAAEIADMGEALKMSGVAAANFGLTFEDANAALQLLSTNAIKGSMAGTNLKGVILALETKMSDEFKPSVVGMVQAMENLGNANLTAKEQVKLFGRENLVAGQILGNSSAQLKQLVEDVTGTNMAYEQAATRADTLQGSQKRLGNAFEELSLILVSDTGFGALLKVLVDTFAGFIQLVGFAITGLVNLTQATWDMVNGFEFMRSFLGEAGDAFSYLYENIDYVRIILANDLINAVSYVGEFFYRSFLQMAQGPGVAINAILDLGIALAEFVNRAGPAFDLIFGTNVTDSMNGFIDGIRDMKVEVLSVDEVTAQAAQKFGDFRQAMNETTEAEIAALGPAKKLAAERKAAEQALEDEKDALEKLSKEQEKAQKAIDGVKSRIEDELYALQHTTKETAVYNALKQAGVTANSEAGQEIAALVLHLEDEKEAVKRLADEEKRRKDEVAKAAKEAAKAEADALSEIEKASKEAAEESERHWTSMRDTLSDFFFEFAKEGIGAFDTLVEGFRAMIYKMMAEAAANQIILGVSTVFGGTAAANAANGVAGTASGASQGLNLLSAGKSLLSGGVQGVFNSAAGGYEAIADWAQASNLPGMQNVAGAARTTAGQYTGSMTSSFANAGLNIGAGLIGGYAGSKVFGETTGIGSTVGGLVGSIGGPIGTGIGSFIGAGLEKGLSKVFGYGGNNNDGKNTASASFDFGTETFGKGAGSGNSWKKGEGKEQAEGVDQLMGYIKEFGTLVGGVDLKGGISLDSRGKASFNGKEFNDATSMLNYAFKEIIRSSSEVDDALESVILGFEGTADEFSAFAQTQIVIDKAIKAAKNLTPELEAMARQFQGSNEDALLFTASLISLTDVLATNAVTDATEAFATAQQIAADGILGAYNRQNDVLIQAIQNFDGSAASMADLNNAMVLSKQAAFELTTGVMNLQVSMNTMFADSVKSIREQLMTETELAKARLEERDALRAAIDTMLDPNELKAAGEKINQLNNQLFSALTPEEKQRYGEEFAIFGEEAASAISDRFDVLLEKTTNSQESVMKTTEDLLKAYADKNMEAANIIKEAAEILRAAASIPKRLVISAPAGTTVTELQS